jgi:hypothetical protein
MALPDRHSTLHNSVAFASRVSQNGNLQFFLLRHPQKHQQIRMSSPQGTQPIIHQQHLHERKFQSIRYNRIRGKEKNKARPKRSGLFTLSQINEDFTDRDLDGKDFTANQKPKYRPKLPAMKTLHTFNGEGEVAIPTITIENRVKHARH